VREGDGLEVRSPLTAHGSPLAAEGGELAADGAGPPRTPHPAPLDVQALRASEFAWASRGESIYLNSASTGPLPARTVRALAEFNEARTQPHRLTDPMVFGMLDRSRELVARLIGASPAEIALAANTGYGTNLAAFALPLARGDVVLAPDLEFPANVYPWMAAAERRGVEYRRLPLVDGLPDEGALLEAIAREPRVKVVTVTWVSFVGGYRVDLATLARACHERGAYLVVDAIQGVGVAPLDVHAAGVDILTCGAQKWLLSPWGSGFVYVREGLVRELDPPQVSWMAFEGTDDFTRLTDYRYEWRGDARRFEQITLPYQDFAGMNASLELLEELGHAAVVAHVERAASRIVAWAEGRDDVRLVTPRDPAQRAGIVALRPRDPAAASARLKAESVVHSLREGAIRLSPHCFTTDEEIDCALELLGRAD
jgi:cysteine desulfurase/selenocysteine lyase